MIPMALSYRVGRNSFMAREVRRSLWLRASWSRPALHVSTKSSALNPGCTARNSAARRSNQRRLNISASLSAIFSFNVFNKTQKGQQGKQPCEAAMEPAVDRRHVRAEACLDDQIYDRDNQQDPELQRQPLPVAPVCAGNKDDKHRHEKHQPLVFI